MRQQTYFFPAIVLSLASLTMLTACKKFVQVGPPATSIAGSNVYTDNATAASVLTGIYSDMSNGSFATGNGSISFLSGLSADEFTLFGGTSNGNTKYMEFYQNNLSNASNLTFWESFYNYLLQVNSAIEGLNATTALTPAVRQQLLGEARFMRGFIYFYLVNLYGDVPLVLTSNYSTNTNIPRTPKAQVWQQVITDLRASESLLSTNYLDATLVNTTDQRVRPTQWSALAMLARAYLYTGNWSGADSAASAVIGNTSLFGLDPLNSAFLANSTEAIWQLQPVQQGWNTADAHLFILPKSGPNKRSWPVSLNTALVNSFEPGDQRRTNWVDSVTVGSNTYYYPYKYKSATNGAPVTEYLMVLRLGEQYLIRAEAEAEQANISAALLDLDTVRTRAGLSAYTGATDQASVLSAIYHERRVELFSEWGHRWLDLKRTGTVDNVMGSPGNACAAKKGNWSANWEWYPIPLYDLQQDLSLVQNAGY